MGIRGGLAVNILPEVWSCLQLGYNKSNKYMYGVDYLAHHWYCTYMHMYICTTNCVFGSLYHIIILIIIDIIIYIAGSTEEGLEWASIFLKKEIGQ